jgi:DNA-binding transcriptional LysR family regulator/energy-coupling factor transporter ATP-binding protein EcfA2
MSRLQDLEVFVQVVNSGNFAKAAAVLDINPSAISRRISHLEDQLGVRLFHRTTRSLSLTDVGDRYFNRCLKILADLEEADREAKQHGEAPQGLLCVSCSTMFAHQHLLARIPAFLAQYSRLRIQLLLTDDVVDIVGESIDVAIRIGELADSSLITRRLVSDRRIICAAPAYLDRYGTPETPDDLAIHNCLTLNAYKTTLNQWRFRDQSGLREISVGGNFMVNSGVALYEAVLAGLGIARVTQFLAGRALQDGRLIRILSKYEDENDVGIYAMFPSNRYLLPKVQCFIEFLVNSCLDSERDYISGRVLKHSLFHGHEGWTILFETNHFNGYSDAFAGSGESAAALLVHNILQAPKGSLILLDEPETSLHPRAQQRMLEFIAHQAVRKSLQIVMATHSIYFAKGLPQQAIRVLVLGQDGTVTVRTDLLADEALHEIGTLPTGKTILVEDERAKHVVISALKLSSSHALSEFQVLVREGGASRMYRDIVAFANSGRNDVFVVFDGDNKPEKTIPKDGALPQGEDDLNKLIREIIRGNDEQGPDLKFWNVDEMMRYIRFLRCSVHFLPELTPENFVWDDAVANELLGKQLPQEILQEQDLKKRLHLLAEEIPGLDADTVFKNLLAKLLSGGSQRKSNLMEVIQKIRSATV